MNYIVTTLLCGVGVLLTASGCEAPEDSASTAASAAPVALEEWCYGKVNPDVPVPSTVDTARAREELVALWDQFLVQQSIQLLGIAPDSVSMADDSLIQELREAKVMGAWSQGDTLWLGAAMIIPPTLNPGVEPGSPEHVQAYFASYFADVKGMPVPETPEQAGPYCMWMAIPAFFDNWQLVDGEEGLPIAM